MYYCNYLYALIQYNQNNQHKEYITTTTFLLSNLTIMFSTGQCVLVAAAKYQMVRYDQGKNAISATSSYSQDVSNEVLHSDQSSTSENNVVLNENSVESKPCKIEKVRVIGLQLRYTVFNIST